MEQQRPLRHQGRPIMAEAAEDKIVRNLIEALERLQGDLDRVELWTAALGYFHREIPDYKPSDQNLLPPRARH
jgi:hypothetical protein